MALARCVHFCTCFLLLLSANPAQANGLGTSDAFKLAPDQFHSIQLNAQVLALLSVNDSPALFLDATETPTPAPISASSVAIPPLHVPSVDNAALGTAIATLRSTALAPAGPKAGTNRTRANAAWILGLLYLHGIGMPVNMVDAATWFERAQALGEPMAPAGLAWCALEGCTQAPNPAAARRWLAPLRAVNAPRAQFFQWLIDTRLSPLRIATPSIRGEEAAALLPNRQLLLSAAQGGDIHAAIELGFQSLANNRPAQALDYFRAAAPKSSVATTNVEILLENRTVPSPGQLPVQTTASSETTLAQAQRNHRGEGQPANFSEAIRLYQLAQRQGSDEATRMLALIFSQLGPGGQLDIAWMQKLAYLNLSKDTVRLDNATGRQVLKRELTPLIDLLPTYWLTQVRQSER